MSQSPLGQLIYRDPFEPELGSKADFADGLNKLVDERVNYAMRNRTKRDFSGVPDVDLMMELIARGFAVWLPKPGQGA